MTLKDSREHDRRRLMVYYEVYGGKMVTIRMIIEFNFYMILVPAWSEDGKIEY